MKNSERNTTERQGARFAFPAAAGAVIWKGTMVALNAGNAAPGAAIAARACLRRGRCATLGQPSAGFRTRHANRCPIHDEQCPRSLLGLALRFNQPGRGFAAPETPA